MCIQSDAARLLNIDDRDGGGGWRSLQEEGNNSCLGGPKALKGQNKSE